MFPWLDLCKCSVLTNNIIYGNIWSGRVKVTAAGCARKYHRVKVRLRCDNLWPLLENYLISDAIMLDDIYQFLLNKPTCNFLFISYFFYLWETNLMVYDFECFFLYIAESYRIKCIKWIGERIMTCGVVIGDGERIVVCNESVGCVGCHSRLADTVSTALSTTKTFGTVTTLSRSLGTYIRTTYDNSTRNVQDLCPWFKIKCHLI